MFSILFFNNAFKFYLRQINSEARIVLDANFNFSLTSIPCVTEVRNISSVEKRSRAILCRLSFNFLLLIFSVIVSVSFRAKIIFKSCSISFSLSSASLSIVSVSFRSKIFFKSRPISFLLSSASLSLYLLGLK